MRYVPYTELDPGAGKEYLPGSYPSPGLYFNPRNQQVYLCHTVGITCCVMSISPCLTVVDVPEPVELASDPRTGVSEDFLLRLAAICQQPSLAPQLLAQQ